MNLSQSLATIFHQLDRDEAVQLFSKPVFHSKMVTVTVAWSVAGAIHQSFLNPGETVIAEKYCQ